MAARPKPPHPGDLIKTIRSLVGQGKVGFTAHALEQRMKQRGFDIDDVYELLAKGDIPGTVGPGRELGEWKCLVVGRLHWTSRETGVATVVVRKERLVIITVEWMDP